MRVVVDGTGHLVGAAYTGTVLEAGQQLVDVTPADFTLLETGRYHWESFQPAIDQLTAWRSDTRAQQVLDLTGDLTGNLLRNIVQDLIRQTQRHARILKSVLRNGTSPHIVADTDEPLDT